MDASIANFRRTAWDRTGAALSHRRGKRWTLAVALAYGTAGLLRRLHLFRGPHIRLR